MGGGGGAGLCIIMLRDLIVGKGDSTIAGRLGSSSTSSSTGSLAASRLTDILFSGDGDFERRDRRLNIDDRRFVSDRLISCSDSSSSSGSSSSIGGVASLTVGVSSLPKSSGLERA